MAPVDYKVQRMSRNEARKQVTKIVTATPGEIRFSGHALKELSADGLTTLDALNVLKSTASRINAEGELDKGSYRYRIETNFILVVVAFSPDGSGLSVVTAWDKRKRGKK